MVYPSKISAAAIVEDALALIEAKGAEALSLREVAGRLGVAPNAIYRYFPARDALIATLADRATLALREVIVEAVAGEREPQARLKAMGYAYLDFARMRPHLHALVLRVEQAAPEGGVAAHEQLWADVLALLAPLVPEGDRPSAAVTLWAYLHGLAALDKAGILGGVKPAAADWGLSALLRGLRPPEPSRAEQGKPI